MLVLNEKSVRDFLGGAAAICNQVQEFTKTWFFFYTWRKKEFLNFIKKKLSKVSINFLFKKIQRY